MNQNVSEYLSLQHNATVSEGLSLQHNATVSEGLSLQHNATVTEGLQLQNNEALLKAWLRLSTSIINSRIVSEMSYTESLVCNILYPNTKAGKAMTATELCHATKILKSQMNRTLNQLEQKGIVIRERSASDKRQVLITFNMAHAEQYEKQHKDILAIIDYIIERLGTDETTQAIALLTKIADIADNILQ